MLHFTYLGLALARQSYNRQHRAIVVTSLQVHLNIDGETVKKKRIKRIFIKSKLESTLYMTATVGSALVQHFNSSSRVTCMYVPCRQQKP